MENLPPITLEEKNNLISVHQCTISNSNKRSNVNFHDFEILILQISDFFNFLMIAFEFCDYYRFSENSKCVGTLKYLEILINKICKNTPQIAFLSTVGQIYHTTEKWEYVKPMSNSFMTIALA